MKTNMNCTVHWFLRKFHPRWFVWQPSTLSTLRKSIHFIEFMICKSVSCLPSKVALLLCACAQQSTNTSSPTQLHLKATIAMKKASIRLISGRKIRGSPPNYTEPSSPSSSDDATSTAAAAEPSTASAAAAAAVSPNQPSVDQLRIVRMVSAEARESGNYKLRLAISPSIYGLVSQVRWQIDRGHMRDIVTCDICLPNLRQSRQVPSSPSSTDTTKHTYNLDDLHIHSNKPTTLILDLQRLYNECDLHLRDSEKMKFARPRGEINPIRTQATLPDVALLEHFHL